MIKLEQYKIFNEAASTLSFSQAAKNLYISQSAVSQTIHALEKELHTQLFIRKSKGVTLTKEGMLLHKNITDALSLITSVENELSQHHDLTSGELVIGAGDSICENYLVDLLKQFHQLYPTVKVNVINGTSLETIDYLKEGKIDIAFINLPYQEESLEVKECFPIHDIFVSKDKDDHIYSYQEIAQKDLILLEKASNSRHYIDKYFAREGILLKPEMELGAHQLLLEFAHASLGIACVIKEFSQNELRQNKVYEMKLKKPLPSRSIGYAYLKRKSLSVASLKFLELISLD